MWSLEFVEVADDELVMTKRSIDRYDDAVPRDVCDAVLVVDKSSPGTRPLDMASRVSSRHSNLGAAAAAEYSSSLDSETGHMQCAIDNWLSAEKLSCDDATTPTSHADQQHDDTPAAAAAAAGEMFVMDDDDEPQIPASAARAQAARSDTLSSIPTVSVETPESGEFCFVTEQDVSDTQLLTGGVQQRQRRKLRDGFHWQKQLVFRSKLTMHTAFERKDNKDPAAVTALAVSRCPAILLAWLSIHTRTRLTALFPGLPR